MVWIGEKLCGAIDSRGLSKDERWYKELEKKYFWKEEE
jgi:hypothetical protein